MVGLQRPQYASSALFNGGLALIVSGLLLAPGFSLADDRTGEQIYRQRCASCHGPAGQGTDDYPHPLEGEKNLDQLARFIAKTMPKGAKQKCTADEAQKVASYVYDAFYSVTARTRNKPPRIELSRLTVRQYRQTVADLVGSFRSPGRWDAERGLHAEYFDTRRMQDRNRFLDRRDAVVQFSSEEAEYQKTKAAFLAKKPKTETKNPNAMIPPDEVSIRWQGSVLAPEDGEYEFVVRTENATRLWVNDLVRPLIDRWVRSGNDTEYRATIRLLAGRAYPLRLELLRSREKSISMSLLWKLPGRVDEIIPSWCLSPNRFPETYVVTTAFPPDDRSDGYERGTSISKAWDQATTEAAIDTAGYITSNLRELSGVADDAKDRSQRLREFCQRFAERAFRRPLTAEEQKFFLDRTFAPGIDPKTTVKRAMLLVLLSPRFLYREVGDDQTYQVASRIAFDLWDSLPDAELLKAAASGQLQTPEHIKRQAERMANDLRTRAKLRAFLHQWLKVEQVDLSKDRKRFPEFDQAMATDLRTSLDLFLDEIIESDGPSFRQLFQADYLHLNGRLARFYGAKLPANASFQKVPFDPQQRAGILTHPYLMAHFAYTASSSPIHRGVFLARNVLGLALRPPPEAFTPLPAELHPELTTRERVALQTKPQACQSCHAVINPLGFTLEHFDAVGRYREKEEGRPINATGAYQTRSGAQVQFANVRELANFLADSEDAQEAFVEQLFQYLVKQPIRAYGPDQLPNLRRSFAQQGFNLRKLVVAIIEVAARNEQVAKP